MKLYRGTDGAYLEHILQEGLKPRGNNAGNWKHTVKSHPDCVYLTNSYPTHFVPCAREGSCCVVEIDIDKLDMNCLLPDEDVLAQLYQRQHKDGWALNRRTAQFLKHLIKHAGTDNWLRSLEYMGTCAHYGLIPPSAITRYVVWAAEDGCKSLLRVDPPSLLNYAYMKGEYHRNVLERFGDVEPLALAMLKLNKSKLRMIIAGPNMHRAEWRAAVYAYRQLGGNIRKLMQPELADSFLKHQKEPERFGPANAKVVILGV